MRRAGRRLRSGHAVLAARTAADGRRVGALLVRQRLAVDRVRPVLRGRRATSCHRNWSRWPSSASRSTRSWPRTACALERPYVGHTSRARNLPPAPTGLRPEPSAVRDIEAESGVSGRSADPREAASLGHRAGFSPSYCQPHWMTAWLQAPGCNPRGWQRRNGVGELEGKDRAAVLRRAQPGPDRQRRRQADAPGPGRRQPVRLGRAGRRRGLGRAAPVRRPDLPAGRAPGQAAPVGAGAGVRRGSRPTTRSRPRSAARCSRTR